MAAPASAWRTRSMSRSGTRSVTQTTSGTPASTASIMAAPACGAGTKTRLALAFVSRIASATVSKTGRERCWRPPFPGVTPATTFVPYSIAWSV